MLVSIGLTTCTKHEAYPDTGGLLPTNYISLQSTGTASPLTLRVAGGSSITVVNNDSKPHHITGAGVKEFCVVIGGYKTCLEPGFYRGAPSSLDARMHLTGF